MARLENFHLSDTMSYCMTHTGINPDSKGDWSDEGWDWSKNGAILLEMINVYVDANYNGFS